MSEKNKWLFFVYMTDKPSQLLEFQLLKMPVKKKQLVRIKLLKLTHLTKEMKGILYFLILTVP